MADRNLEFKYDILKARITSLVEEHADALALAQVFKKECDQLGRQLQESNIKISKLEKLLKENDVQEKDPQVTVINQSVEPAEH